LLAKGATWSGGHELPHETNLGAFLRSQQVKTTTTEVGASSGVPPVKILRREFLRPYIAHAAMAPSCALARWSDGRLWVRSHSQGVYNLRRALAQAFGFSEDAIEVEHAEGAGCYGHNAADDVGLDAALLARAVPDRVVRVVWSRADELAWAPVGAAMAITIEAGLDANGEIVSWQHEIWSNGFSSRPGRGTRPTMLAAGHIGKKEGWVLSGGDGAERNAKPPYKIPGCRIVANRLLTMPIRVSSLRSLGANGNVFAHEQMIDEVAALKGEDPVAIRLRLLDDPRGRAAVEAVAKHAGWAQWKCRDGAGHGIGYARYKGNGAYCAVVAEIEAAAEVRVRRLVIAVDVGEVINPDGVINQIEGGAIQTTSWTLKEAVRFDRTRITSDSWETYPILRFSEVPAVEVVLIDRPEAPPLGAGEATQGPVAAAIANALYDALGVRVRELPLTPERIVAAMERQE
jgi:CO/xanthine dehydrogenase Mo-binding subunit